MSEQTAKEVVAQTEENKDEVQLTPEEKDASEQGWVPKDAWKGKEDEWVPAKAFLKYGHVESELKRIRSESSQKEKVIKSMKDYYLNVKEDVRKEVLDSLRKQKKDAIREENYQEAAKIDLQLEEITDNLDRKIRIVDEKVRQAEQSQHVGPPSEFYEWNKRNSWYKLGGTDSLTKEADVLAVAYAQVNPRASYPEVLEYVTKAVRKQNPEKFENGEQSRERGDAVNEPGEREADSTTKKRPRLTAAEKEAAAAFGMTTEEYAEGLKRWDTMKGVV